MVAAGQVRLFDVAAGMNDKFLPPGFAGAVTNTGTIVTERKYLPTFDSLVDRLSIVLLKSIFITEVIFKVWLIDSND